MSGPGAGHVRARSRTCPVKTASTVLETSEAAKNRYSMDFGIGPIEYIYV
jgi:hypothetical protein